MSTSFNPRDPLIRVFVHVFGPQGDYYARVALDTGASFTFVNKDILVLIGYDPDALPKTVTFTTGSGVETAARVTVDKLQALCQERLNFSVIAHTFPPTASIDGLLGLDFFRNHVLSIDFQNGQIDLV